MPVNRRLLVVSLLVAVVLSVAIGWAIARDGAGADDDTIVLDRGAVPSIATNAEVAGERLPSVELVDDDGDTLSTDDLVGRPLVLNLWFSTCIPCERELPAFAAVHEEFGDAVRFVGVNPFDSAEVNRSFARDRGVGYELLRDPDGAFADELGVSTAPFTVFVRPDGTIARQTGVLDEDELRAHVEDLLA